MTVYYSLIIFLIVFGAFAQYTNAHNPAHELVSASGKGITKNYYSFFYLLIIAAFLFIGGFRYYVGTDFGGYYKEIVTFPDLIDSIKQFDEPIIKIITFLSRKIWDDGVFVIFVENALIVLLIFYGISKYDKNNIMFYSLLFLFTGIWTFSFNGVRQAVACAIIFAGISIIEKQENTTFKLVLKIAFLCFVAYLTHKSAIFMLPMILISHGKFDYKQILLLIVSSAVIPLFFSGAYEVMDTNSSSVEGAIYINQEINPIRVLVAIPPLVLIAFVKDRKELFDEDRVVTNMALFHSILTVTTMNSAYMHRITQYTLCFMMVFIVNCMNKMSGRTRRTATVVTLILYFSYWLYGVLSANEVFHWSFSHFGEF